MDTPSAIIRALGGPSKVAAALGIPSPSVVAKWAARESIPGRYWAGLVEIGAEVPQAHVTPALLAELHRASA